IVHEIRSTRDDAVACPSAWLCSCHTPRAHRDRLAGFLVAGSDPRRRSVGETHDRGPSRAKCFVATSSRVSTTRGGGGSFWFREGALPLRYPETAASFADNFALWR